MVQVINELTDKSKISAAKAYAAFGKKQVEVINKRLGKWLSQQSFAKGAPNPKYGSMKISGTSDGTLLGRETQDNVEWDLRFKDQLDDKLGCSWITSGFNDGVLHIKRLPDVEKHNSSPQLFKTVNYIQVRVSNGERGWVETGTFPKNTHIEQRLEDEEKLTYRRVPVFTNIKQDAQAGFRAAEEWAKFRTMAVASKGYIEDRLKKEWEKVGNDYDANRRMRSRTETALPLMLQFLPDTLVQKGPSSLQLFYEPGVLEATAALELEKLHGRCIFHGLPIEISPIQGGESYDAVFSLSIGINPLPETARAIVGRELGKYFDINMENLKELRFRFPIKDAHKVSTAIYEGRENTPLHTQTRALVDAIKVFYQTTYSWSSEQLPVLKKGYEAMVEGAMQEHFGRMEQKLLTGSIVSVKK
jgi:hypothetical protein